MIIALGIVIGSGSLYRYAYSYNLIMFAIMGIMFGLIFYRIFVPVNDNQINSYVFNLSGIVLIMFFMFFPTMSDVINQVESYEISYYYIVFILLSFLLGTKTREKIFYNYLIIIVILAFISLFYFFINLISDLPKFLPYYGIPKTTWLHFYYVWSKPVTEMIITRNQSIFWEPGAFGFHLIIAILIAIKANKKSIITILIITCLTTMSTTVYLFLLLLLFYYLFYSNNKPRYIGILLISSLFILLLVKIFFGSFEIPLQLLGVITEKFSPSGSGYSSMQERNLYVFESLKLFYDNLLIGAGHYATDTLLKNTGSETSALAALLAELGLFGLLCIILYIRFFKKFKIFAIPIALLWLNGEFFQYMPIAIFILAHMVEKYSIKLFPPRIEPMVITA